MKALSFPKAITFYLESRRRLGFALESEGALLENLVEYAQEFHHRGPLTTDLALNWAQMRARKSRRQVCLVRLTAEFPYISSRAKRSLPCWLPLSNCPRPRVYARAPLAPSWVY